MRHFEMHPIIDVINIDGIYDNGNNHAIHAHIKHDRQNKTINPISIGASIDKIRLYPNPVKADYKITLKYPYEHASILVTVYSISGQQVSQFRSTADKNHTLLLKNLPKGTYFIRLSDTENKVDTTGKLILL